MIICDVCGKRLTGKGYKLEIKIVKQILTPYGFGYIKDFKEISGHYGCVKHQYGIFTQNP